MPIFSKIFTLIGIILTLAASLLFLQRNNPNRLSFNGYHAQSINEVKQPNQPAFLIMKDLDIVLPVVPVLYENNKWKTTYKGVSFLSDSSLPGDAGNSIFYGHNWKSLLGGLVNAKPGQEIEIVFGSGLTKNFKIEYVQVVSPDQTDILNQTEDKRITLYTCTGFMDSKRLVVVAKAVS